MCYFHFREIRIRSYWSVIRQRTIKDYFVVCWIQRERESTTGRGQQKQSLLVNLFTFKLKRISLILLIHSNLEVANLLFYTNWNHNDLCSITVTPTHELWCYNFPIIPHTCYRVLPFYAFVRKAQKEKVEIQFNTVLSHCESTVYST